MAACLSGPGGQVNSRSGHLPAVHLPDIPAEATSLASGATSCILPVCWLLAVHPTPQILSPLLFRRAKGKMQGEVQVEPSEAPKQNLCLSWYLGFMAEILKRGFSQERLGGWVS